MKRALFLGGVTVASALLVWGITTRLITFDSVVPWVLEVRTLLIWLLRINVFAIGIVIFLENKNPSRTVAWLLVLSLLPAVGFLFYVLFGRSYRKRRQSRQKHLIDSVKMNHAAEVQQQMLDIMTLPNMNDARNRRMMSLLLNNAKAPFSIQNDIKVLTNGYTKFNMLLEALKGADHHIHLEYFIIKDDTIGNEVRKVLMDKAQAGVEVRVIYDAVGSWRLGKPYIQALKEAGVEMKPFFPVVFPFFSRELNYRNHRKIAVIDGKIGFVGGLNIGDEYLGDSDKFEFWRDTHLQVIGEGVYALQSIFLNDWHFVAKEALHSGAYYPEHKVTHQSLAQIVASGPDSEWQSILQAYYKMIASATDKIWITSPYLVPEESILMGLKTAALSGIDVKIIIPSMPDHFFVYWASRANIESLLEAGVKVYQYDRGFIHSKIMIVDRLLATVGTANMDIRSMEINFEVNAFLYDEEVIIRLEEDFVKDVMESQAFVLETFAHRSYSERFLEALGRLVSPLQ